jgi:hypothetical protein
MRRKKQIKQRVVKGTSSAVVLSIAIHAGLFFLAGALVISRVMNNPETIFKAPPPAKVPKMPLKKLTPKVKKPSKPKSTAKIVAVVEKVALNQIQFPDLASSGIGTGISEGADVVTFGDMPSFDDGDGPIGNVVSIGNDLEGTYYDTKRRRGGTFNGSGRRGDPYTYRPAVEEFIESGYDTSSLAAFYRAPDKRYANCIMVPTMSSSVAPAAFGEDPGTGLFWLVHYKGQIVYPEDITFRFWAAADHFMGVRVGETDVLFAAWQGERDDFKVDWRGNDSKRDAYYLGYNTRLEPGDWVTLKAGEPQTLQVIIGDNGGLAAQMLLVEVKGVDYPQNKQGGPILPVFKTSPLSHDQIDAIYRDLPPNECCLTTGPVFSDYSKE